MATIGATELGADQALMMDQGLRPVTAQYRTASGSDRMLPLTLNRTAFNDGLNLASGRYRSRFCIER